jgi:hypothetical protein
MADLTYTQIKERILHEQRIIDKLIELKVPNCIREDHQERLEKLLTDLQTLNYLPEKNKV